MLEVAIPVIASPSAPPTCCEALSSAAASPALSAGTPAFAAVLSQSERPSKKATAISCITAMPEQRRAWTARDSCPGSFH